MKSLVRALVLLLALSAVVCGGALYSIARRGLGTRVDPSWMEELLARGMRRLATPAAVRLRPNHVAPDGAVLDDALAHFADHCAVCHANDGSGDTAMGRNLYPRAPDMRGARTQDLTDGELFWIIENGIRLTGMPAWGEGTPESERASWGLVHFIRKLPSLGPEEIVRMEALNPRSPEQFREEEEIRRFLSGEDLPDESPGERPHEGRHD